MKVLSLFLVVLMLAAPVGADGPATGSGAAEAFGQRLEQLAADAASSDAATRTKALTTLGLLQRSLLETLASHLQDKDPEVRARVATVLVELDRQMRIARAMAAMGPQQQEKFRALEKTHPELCRAMLLGNASAKLSALRDIRLAAGRDKAFEPLALLGLYSQHLSVQNASMELIEQFRYSDPQIVKRLTDLAANIGNFQRMLIYDPMQMGLNVHSQALAVLAKIAPPEAAPRLAAMAMSNSARNWDHSGRNIRLADAAIATGYKALIPALIPKLSDTNVISAMNMGNGNVGFANSDMALYMLLKLTGQEIADYELTLMQPNFSYNIMGFASDEKRKAAITAFKAWWEQNKNKPGYKDLTPATLPTDANRSSEEVAGDFID